jgi:hypothetical protein
MNKRDTPFDLLELLVDPVEAPSDGWKRVLRDAGHSPVPLSRLRGRSLSPVTRPSRPWRGRGAFRVAAAVTAAGIAVFAALSLAPSGKGCSASVLACAAAAIQGDGPVLHIVEETFAPVPGRIEIWYDTESETSYSINLRDGAPVMRVWSTPEADYVVDPNGTLKLTGDRNDPTLRYTLHPILKFFGSMEEQVRNGKARLAGESRFDGRDVYLIDFAFTDDTDPQGNVHHIVYRIAVDKQTYEPVSWNWADGDGHGETPTVARILEAEFGQRNPDMFVVPKSVTRSK